MTEETDPPAASKAVTYQLRVRPETRNYFEGVRERTGVSAAHIAAKMCDFFARQPDDVKGAILGRGSPEELIARKWMADNPPADTSMVPSSRPERTEVRQAQTKAKRAG